MSFGKNTVDKMAFMYKDNKSFAKHIQESGTTVEDSITNLLNELGIVFSRPKGKGLKIDYITSKKAKIIGIELKKQDDGQTAYEKVPHAVFKYAFENPTPLDEMWLLLLGEGWEKILKSPAGGRIIRHIDLLQKSTDTKIIVIKDINDFIKKLENKDIKKNNFF